MVRTGYFWGTECERVMKACSLLGPKLPGSCDRAPQLNVVRQY